MITYLIKKGKHKSKSGKIKFLPLFFIDKHQFKFKFSKDCIYPNSYGKYQINKLSGVAFGIPNIFNIFNNRSTHQNSFRIGWRPLNSEKIGLIAYYYINGKRYEKNMISVLPEKEYYCDIKFNKSKINVKVDNVKFEYYYNNNKNYRVFGYRLFPYFGGLIPAPHNMKIYLSYGRK